MAGMSVIQVGLGIFALLTYVPTWLGSAHQAGAIVLLSMAMGKAMTLPNQIKDTSRNLTQLEAGQSFHRS